MDNDNKIVKYKGYVRKSAINILAWLENNPNPTQEKAQELLELRGKIKDAIFNYFDNIKPNLDQLYKKQEVEIENSNKIKINKIFIIGYFRIFRNR